MKYININGTLFCFPIYLNKKSIKGNTFFGIKWQISFSEVTKPFVICLLTNNQRQSRTRNWRSKEQQFSSSFPLTLNAVCTKTSFLENTHTLFIMQSRRVFRIIYKFLFVKQYKEKEKKSYRIQQMGFEVRFKKL